MQENKDFTLIIHGPLSIYTVFTLYRYKDLLPIIIVIPRPTELKDNNILTEVQSLMQQKDTRISLFMYDDVWAKTVNNEQNRYAHFYSVYLGLQASNTKYSIKMRSDEFYSDLQPIIDVVEEKKNKLVTTEVFFRNSQLLLHPSDHMIAGNTEMMLKTFEAAKLLCEGVEVPNSSYLIKYVTTQNTRQIEGKDKNWLAAEQCLGIGAVLSQYAVNKLKELNNVEWMKDIFYIVPTSELGLFRVMFNSAKDGPIEYTNTSYFNEETDVDDIENYK